MDKDGIIAMSPVITEPGTTQHRVVIRDLREKYVVHTQVLEEDREPWYVHGDYFYKGNSAATVAESDKEALAKAWAQFEKRARRSMHLEEVGVL